MFWIIVTSVFSGIFILLICCYIGRLYTQRLIGWRFLLPPSTLVIGLLLSIVIEVVTFQRAKVVGYESVEVGFKNTRYIQAPVYEGDYLTNYIAIFTPILGYIMLLVISPKNLRWTLLGYYLLTCFSYLLAILTTLIYIWIRQT